MKDEGRRSPVCRKSREGRQGQSARFGRRLVFLVLVARRRCGEEQQTRAVGASALPRTHTVVHHRQVLKPRGGQASKQSVSRLLLPLVFLSIRDRWPNVSAAARPWVEATR